MILNIFIPESVGTYYVMPHRTVGIYIGHDFIHATVVKAMGEKRIIEKFLKEPIIQEQVSEALKKILHEVGSYNSISTAVPSSLAIFKEITVPFTDHEKIKLILPFEVEPLLPFPLSEAVLDFIVIGVDETNKNSTILIAALKKEQLQEHLDIFSNAGVTPDRVTIDLLEIYGLYKSIAEYAKIPGTVVLLDIGMHTTNILVMMDGSLKMIRVLNKGIAFIINSLMREIKNVTEPEAYNLLFKSGFNEESVRTGAFDFFNEIQFTLQAALSKIVSIGTVQKVFLIGPGAEIPHLTEFLTQFMNCPCDIMYMHKIIQDGIVIASSQERIPHDFYVSFATALSSTVTRDVNMRADYASKTEENLLFMQTIVAICLGLLIITTFSVYSFLTLRTFSNEAFNSEKESIEKLKKVFTFSKKGTIATLQTANALALAELKKEEDIWFALSSGNRFSFLTYLQELSSRIDREKLGLDLKKLIIRGGQGNTEDTMTLEGSVKDYDALRTFEEALNSSKMFKNIPKLQEPKFGTITFALEKNERERT